MNSLLEEEKEAIQLIQESGRVDLMPPNQLGIPIAAEQKMGYLYSAIECLNSAIKKLKKIKKEFEPYGMNNNSNNDKNNNNESMEGGKRKHKTRKHKTRKYRK